MKLRGQTEKERRLFYNVCKQTIDIIGSTLGIILFFPIFIIVPIVIKLDSKGPVFFAHTRLGKDRRKIICHKFRTMEQDADKIFQNWFENDTKIRKQFEQRWKLIDDQRITKFGKILRKTSLDEIPQLFDVLRGDMSLVGPRPMEEKEGENKCKKYLEEILGVKPGITGYWLISGRNELPYNEKIKCKLYYVRNRSFWLDVSILIKTIPAIIKYSGY